MTRNNVQQYGENSLTNIASTSEVWDTEKVKAVLIL